MRAESGGASELLMPEINLGAQYIPASSEVHTLTGCGFGRYFTIRQEISYGGRVCGVETSLVFGRQRRARRFFHLRYLPARPDDPQSLHAGVRVEHEPAGFRRLRRR